MCFLKKLMFLLIMCVFQLNCYILNATMKSTLSIDHHTVSQLTKLPLTTTQYEKLQTQNTQPIISELTSAKTLLPKRDTQSSPLPPELQTTTVFLPKALVRTKLPPPSSSLSPPSSLSPQSQDPLPLTPKLPPSPILPPQLQGRLTTLPSLLPPQLQPLTPLPPLSSPTFRQFTTPKSTLPLLPPPQEFTPMAHVVRTVPKSIIFPFSEFFNVTVDNSDLLIEYGCTMRTEVNSINGGRKPCCSCSNDCWKYRTCCIDKLWPESKTGDIDAYLIMFEAEVKKQKKIDCQKVISLDNINHDIETISMVTNCPIGPDKTLIDNCQNKTLNVVPVIGNDKYVYKNEYCARCNNVINFETLELEVRCVNADRVNNLTTLQLETLEKLNECVVSVIKTGVNKKYINKCVSFPPEDLGECDERDRWLCSLYEGTPFSGNYMNPHCLKCSSTTLTQNYTSQLRCPARCNIDKWCFLPDEKDLSKYPHVFHLANNAGVFSNVIVVSNYHQFFPIWEFLEIPLTHKFGKDKGLEQYLCSGRREQCCECGKDCMSNSNGYKRCCVDVFWNQSHPISMNDYKELLIVKADKTKHSFCLPVYPSAKLLGYKSDMYHMIRSCRKSSMSVDRALCVSNPSNSSIVTNIPVYDKDGNLYANSYCAKCNFIDNFQYANLTLNCDIYAKVRPPSSNETTNQTPLPLKDRLKHCAFRLAGYSPQLTCYPDPKNTPRTKSCKRLDQNHYLCRSYLAEIVGFDNPHCMKCSANSSYADTLSKLKYCEDYCSFGEDCNIDTIPPTPTTPPPWHFYRWSFLLTFSGDVASVAERDESSAQVTCERNNVYDIALAKCVEFTCPFNYKAVGLECVHFSPAPKTVMLIVDIMTSEVSLPSLPIPDEIYTYASPNVTSLNPNIRSPRPNVTSPSQSLPPLSIKRLPYLYISMLDYRIYVQLPHHCFANVSLKLLFTKLSKHFNRNFTFASFVEIGNTRVFRSNETFAANLLPYIWTISLLEYSCIHIYIAHDTHSSLVSTTYGLNFSRYFHGHRLCAMPRLVSEVELETNTNQTLSIHYKNKTLNLYEASFWITISNGSVQENTSFCEGFHLLKPCARTLLTRNDTRLGVSSLDLTFSIGSPAVTTISYNYSEYLPTKTGYYVCVTTSNKQDVKQMTLNPNSYKTLLQIEYYVTLVGTSISIICYISIVLTYVLFKDLRTVPGLNTCFMCVSLLISDTLFMAVAGGAYKNQIACIAIAVVMHWSLLTAFVWILIISYDLVLRFGSFSVYSKDRGLKRMTYRSAIAFLLPAVLVSIAIGLDRTNKFSVGYGTNGFCWLTNVPARIGFYIVPTTLALVLALTSMIFSIIRITQEKRKTQKRLQREKLKVYVFLKMATKLSMVLGLTELIGYIQFPPSNKDEQLFNVALDFVYTITRSLRGLMLWFVYIYWGSIVKRYRKRVANSLRKKPKAIRSDTPALQLSQALSTKVTSLPVAVIKVSSGL